MKRQAAGRQDQFGGAVLKTGAGGSAPPGGRETPVTIDESESCFDSLVTSAKRGKTTLGELVRTNSTLTSSIAELATRNTQITKKVAILSQEVNKYKKGVNKLMVEEEIRPSIVPTARGTPDMTQMAVFG